MKKGQASIESLMIFMIIIIIGTVVIFGINQRNLNIQLAGESLEAKEEAEKVAKSINDAAIAGNGFEKTVTIRRSLGTIPIQDFVVVPVARTVRVQWVDADGNLAIVEVPTITSDIIGVGSIWDGNDVNFTATSQNVFQINNTNGDIMIEGVE